MYFTSLVDGNCTSIICAFKPSSKYIQFHLPQVITDKQYRISHRIKIKRSNLTHAFWNSIAGKKSAKLPPSKLQTFTKDFWFE